MREQDDQNRLPGTRRINFTILKRQIGYRNWNSKNFDEKKKIKQDY